MSTTTNTKPTVNAKKRKVEESKVETEGLLIVENIETFLQRVRKLAMDTTDTEMFEDIDDDVKPYLKWAETLKYAFDATVCYGEKPVKLMKAMMKKVDPIIDKNDEEHDMFDILTEFCHALRDKLEDDDDSDEWLEALTIRLTVDPAKPAKPEPKPAKRVKLSGPEAKHFTEGCAQFSPDEAMLWKHNGTGLIFQFDVSLFEEASKKDDVWAREMYLNQCPQLVFHDPVTATKPKGEIFHTFTKYNETTTGDVAHRAFGVDIQHFWTSKEDWLRDFTPCKERNPFTLETINKFLTFVSDGGRDGTLHSTWHDDYEGTNPMSVYNFHQQLVAKRKCYWCKHWPQLAKLKVGDDVVFSLGDKWTRRGTISNMYPSLFSNMVEIEVDGAKHDYCLVIPSECGDEYVMDQIRRA